MLLSICALVAWPAIASAPQNGTMVRDEDMYVRAISRIPELKAPLSTYNSCVLYVQARMGIREVWGYPNLLKVSQTPRIGGAVITTEGPLGHAAYIEDISGSDLYVSESNFIAGKVSKRVINMDAAIIRGYYP